MGPGAAHWEFLLKGQGRAGSSWLLPGAAPNRSAEKSLCGTHVCHQLPKDLRDSQVKLSQREETTCSEPWLREHT